MERSERPSGAGRNVCPLWPLEHKHSPETDSHSLVKQRQDVLGSVISLVKVFSEPEGIYCGVDENMMEVLENMTVMVVVIAKS